MPSEYPPIFQDSVPSAPPADIIAWLDAAEIKTDGHTFNSERTPQLLEPIRSMFDFDTRMGTLVKPVQTGGSTAGEVVLCGWLKFRHGKIQYNWQDDGKAEERWPDRIMPCIESVRGLRWGAGRFDKGICKSRFANCTLLVQGVEARGSLDSETIPLQINEEVHLWGPGKLRKARRRQTLVWNGKALDISNAGDEEDQLELSYEEGTMESWHTWCPGCKGYHKMQFRWDDKNPQLGGLRFDTSLGRTNERYNLFRVIESRYYQMPCGFIIHDHPTERRLPGKYVIGNPGAMEGHKSWTYEGVSFHEVKWEELISEYLEAIRARKSGDEEPLRKFVQERECRFWGEKSRPWSGQIIVNKALVKDRAGLANRVARFFAWDRQKGYKHKGETPHFWLVIRDVDALANSLLVYEGMLQTEEDVKAVLNSHGCIPIQGAGDCTWDRESMLAFCYHSGFNALTASAQTQYFSVKGDDDKVVKRIWSSVETVHKLLNTRPAHNYRQVWNEKKKVMEYLPDPREPRHWSYHNIGMIRLLWFLRSHYGRVENKNDGIIWEVPSDVSDDYKKHLSSWEVSVEQKGPEERWVEQFKQLSKNDHLLKCEGYISMLIAMSGILGNRLAMLGVQDTTLGANSTQQ